MTVNLRVRAADALRRRTVRSISDMDLADIEKQQNRPLGHNWLVDRIFGGLAPGVTVRETTIAAASGELRVRLYTPTGRSPVATVVNFHGGGWVLGDLDGNDWTCSTVAARVGAQVVSVKYRLAPQHPFPAGVQDCLDATRWAAGLDPSAGGMAVMGDSAGGNLAAVIALQCRDQGGPELAHQVLIYPATDLTLGSPSLQANADAEMLNLDDVHAFRALYLGPEADTVARDPLASPLLAADLAGLAPALIITAEHDPIRDDGRRYADALRAAGVAVRLTDYVDAPHGFVSIPGLVPSARQAVKEICDELAASFAPASAARR